VLPSQKRAIKNKSQVGRRSNLSEKETPIEEQFESPFLPKLSQRRLSIQHLAKDIDTNNGTDSTI
jgi:hypothetical protein